MEAIAAFFNLFWALDNALSMSRHGVGQRIEWANDGVFSGGSVELFLRKYGVRVYGRKLPRNQDDTWGIRVRSEQAKWADTLLRTWGVPVVSKQIGAPLRTLPQAWGVPAKPTGVAGMLVNSFVGGLRTERKSRSKRRR